MGTGSKAHDMWMPGISYTTSSTSTSHSGLAQGQQGGFPAPGGAADQITEDPAPKNLLQVLEENKEAPPRPDSGRAREQRVQLSGTPGIGLSWSDLTRGLLGEDGAKIMAMWAKLRQAWSGAQTTVQAADPAPEPVEIWASELLDEHTCQKCAEIDGHDYETLAQARVDYPDGGGYKDCESGSGCRGTLVSMYNE